MSMAPDIRTLLADFLTARKLDNADGRPLYAYRCTTSEFEALQHSLRVALSDQPLTITGPSTSRAFCLWGAEWWRRNHAGGSWKWEPLLASLDVLELGPGSYGYPDLVTAVGRGLGWWDRPIITSEYRRAFLMTLACEGGLPLRMVQKEAGHLRTFFRAVFEELQAFRGTSATPGELAERVGFILPKTLRQEVVFRLCGDLADQIWRLHEGLGETDTPVRDLDAKQPGWRDQLPVVLDDATARALLNGLLNEAATLSLGGGTRLEWARALVPDDDGFLLKGEFRVPPSIDSADIREVWDIPEGTPVPSRFEVRRTNGLGQAGLLAIGYPIPRSEHPTFRLEQSARGSLPSFGPEAAVSQELHMQAREAVYTTDDFLGAGSLSELPWVFDAGDGDEQLVEYRFRADGSTKTSASGALVAVTSGTEVTPAPDAVWERRGTVRAIGREVYFLRGLVTISDRTAEAFVRIQTDSATKDERASFVLDGSKIRVRGEDLGIQGIPLVRERSGRGSKRRVPQSDLWWKPKGLSREWAPLTDSAIGEGRLRIVSGRTIRFSTDLTLLPASTRITLVPGENQAEGEIHLEGLAADDVACRATDSAHISCDRRGDTWVIRCAAGEQVPPSITAEVIWHHRGKAPLCLPFPSAGFDFFASDGVPIPEEVRLSLGRLSGCRALAVLPREDVEVVLEGDYLGQDGKHLSRAAKRFRRPLESSARGIAELDLGRVSLLARDQLDGSPDPNALVRLSAHTNSSVRLPGRRLEVTRFDLNMVLDIEASTVQLDERSSKALRPGEAESLRVEWHPYGAGSGDPCTLEREAYGTWVLPTSSKGEPGLLILLQGDWCRARPREWASVKRVDREDLLAQPDSEDWQGLWDLLEVATIVPAHGIGALQVYMSNWDLLTLAALTATDLNLERLYRAAEASRYFLWHLLPLAKWESAIVRLAGSRLAAVDEIDIPGMPLDIREMLCAQLRGSIDRLRFHLPSHPALLAFSVSRAFGTPLDAQSAALPTDQIRALLTGQYEQELNGCPALAMNPSDIDNTEGLKPLFSAVRNDPWAVGLFRSRRGRFASPPVQRFANAPLVSAVASVRGLGVNRAQTAILSGVRAADPAWFDNSYATVALLVYGAMKKEQVMAQMEEFDG